jgi:hypothetical protein
MFSRHQPLAANSTRSCNTGRPERHTQPSHEMLLHSCQRDSPVASTNHNTHPANAHGMDGTRKECPLHLPQMQDLLCIHRAWAHPYVCVGRGHDTPHHNLTRNLPHNHPQQPLNKPQNSIEFVSTPHAPPRLGECTRLMQTMLPGEYIPSACNAVLPAPCAIPASTVSYNPAQTMNP